MVELKRLLLSPKHLVILLMLAMVNLSLFSGYCRTQKAEVVMNWNQMHNWGIDIHRQEQEQLVQYLEKDYPDYLNYIRSQSESQSVLGKLTAQSQKNVFIDRNLEKTVADYKKLGDVTLKMGENRGVKAVKNYDITDYLLLVAPLLMVLELIAESNTAIGDLTRTTKKGRLHMTLWRMLAISIYSAITVVLLYGGNILYTMWFYGNPNFTRALQSIPDYQFCPLPLTIGGYLLAAGCMKVVALTILSLFVWLILSRFHPLLGWIVSGGTAGTLYLFSKLILPTAKVNHLRFLNVFSTLEADTFFTQYCNLNWFSHPSGFLPNMLVTMAILLVTLLVLCVWRIGLSYPTKLGAKTEVLGNKIAMKLNKLLPVHTLFGFEGWKLLFAEKAFWVLLITGALGWSLWKDVRLYLPMDWQVQQLYVQYQGEVKEENITQIARKLHRDGKEKIKLEEQLAMALEIGSKLADRYAYQLEELKKDMKNHEWMLSKMLSTARYNKNSGNNAWVIQEEHYVPVFTEHASEQSASMIILLFLILAFSGICAYDNQYDTLSILRSTKKGRLQMRLSQAAWVVLLTAIVSVAIHGVVLLHIYKDVGLPLLEAPIQSYPAFRDINLPLTMRGAIIWLMIFRVGMASLIAGAIALVSRISNTPSKALLLTVVIFLLPTALAQSGVTQLHFLDFVHYLTCCK